jgi:hypothetical protein
MFVTNSIDNHTTGKESPIFIQFGTIQSYFRETSAFNFSTYIREQLKLTYKVFTEIVSPCDAVENFSNTKKSKTKKVPGYQYRSTSKLCTREIQWEFRERKIAKTQA